MPFQDARIPDSEHRSSSGPEAIAEAASHQIILENHHGAVVQTKGGLCPMRAKIWKPSPEYFEPQALNPAPAGEPQSGVHSMRRTFIRRNPADAMARCQAADRRKAFEEAMRVVFNAFDADGSGFVDVGELGSMLTRLGATFNEGEVRAMLNRTDFDNNGKLDFKEFVLMCFDQGWVQ